MSKPQWVDKEIQSFSSQLVCICYYIFEKQTQPRGVCFYDTMQPLGKKNKNNGTVKTGEQEGAEGELRRLIWGATLHVEVHEKKELLKTPQCECLC